MVARIFRPAKTAMQSGRAQDGAWVLVYEPEAPRAVEPLMGYTSSADMKQEMRLTFASGKRRSPMPNATASPMSVEADTSAPARPISYSDNFATGRRFPWTH